MTMTSLKPEDLPVFKCHVDAAGCRFELRVNDVPVYAQAHPLPLSAEFPVGEYIVDGLNVISLRVQPPAVRGDDGAERFEDEAYDPRDSAIAVRFLVKPSGAAADTKQVIASIEFQPGLESGGGKGPPDPAGVAGSSPAGAFHSERGFAPRQAQDPPADVRVSRCDVERDDEFAVTWITRMVQLPSPYPRWAWQDADELEDDDDLAAAVLQQVRALWHQISRGEVAAVEARLARKVDELAAAYHLRTRTSRREVEILPTLMQSEELTLQPLPADMRVELVGDGRLVQVTDDTDESPIVFTNREDVAYYFGLRFCRLDGQWLLIR